MLYETACCRSYPLGHHQGEICVNTSPTPSKCCSPGPSHIISLWILKVAESCGKPNDRPSPTCLLTECLTSRPTLIVVYMFFSSLCKVLVVVTIPRALIMLSSRTWQVLFVTMDEVSFDFMDELAPGSNVMFPVEPGKVSICFELKQVLSARAFRVAL